MPENVLSRKVKVWARKHKKRLFVFIVSALLLLLVYLLFVRWELLSW